MIRNEFQKAIKSTKMLRPHQSAKFLHQVITGSQNIDEAKEYAEALLKEGLVNNTVEIVSDKTIQAEVVPRGQNGINQLVARARNGTLIVDADNISDHYTRSLQAHLTRAVHTDTECPAIILTGQEENVKKFLETSPEFNSRMPRTHVQTARGPQLSARHL